METEKVDKVKQWRKDRLTRIAEKRNWSPAKLDAVAEKIEKRQANIKVILPAIAGAVVSAAPGGAVIGNVISKIPVVRKLPVLQDIAQDGALVMAADKAAGYTGIQALVRDVIPLWREIEEGDWRGALKAAPVAIGGIVGALVLLGLI